MTVGDVLAYAPQLVEANTRSDSRRGRRGRFPDGLTVREVQVLRLIAGGSTSRAIATELVISIETVGRHISNLYRKIGASGRAEATAYAIRSGLMED
ncbi:helix-turn-helix transcriptional regulator [Rhodococcus opacus]|nr:helix-turn-helix transcriptional regulator [Rhodococcus opacus]